MREAIVRGWCPDLFAPMQSGDGWLLRLKPRLSRLTAAQGRMIAEQAARHGNGIIELTGRGNLQLRGLTPVSAEVFARFAVASGLASPDPAVERRRNILLSPLADDAACDVARALEHGLAADDTLSPLPGKFAFAVDAGPFLGHDMADILLRRDGAAWQVGFASDPEPRCCHAGDAPRLALCLAHGWLASRTSVRPSHRAGTRDGTNAIGWLPALGAFGIGLPFGQMDAITLESLCALAETHGDGVLHLTSWRTVILSGVASAPVIEGDLITEPHDPRRLVSACIGRQGCASGTVDTRADALALLRAGVLAPSLHMSGCVKGCAHPGPAAITLVGADGRYGLVRDGKAGDTTQADGLTLPQVARRLGGSIGGS